MIPFTTPFDARPSPRLLFGPGRLAELPECLEAAGGSKVLLVTDPGIVAAGHVARAVEYLEKAGFAVSVFEGSHVNPTEADAEECRSFAEKMVPDAIVGLGGGSSMDTAKACNFLLRNGGRMADYRGYGHAARPMLPFIAVPTTTGTGSECQSFAIVSHDETHEKMACGDPKALARAAILDPELTYSQPPKVAVLTALDALSHALETAVCIKRNPVSSAYSRQAFAHIASGIEAMIQDPAGSSESPHAVLQIGAALAGSAIENSMLGATHALANPLTAECGTAHGHAVAVILPHVIEFNSREPAAAAIYEEYSGILGEPLTPWIQRLIDLAGLTPPAFPESAIPGLAEAASRQWTGRFNPRPVAAGSLAALYRACLSARLGRVSARQS